MSEAANGAPTHGFASFDPGRVPSPCHVIDLVQLEDNLRRLAGLAAASGADILLALKAFSCFAVADLIGSYLQGTAASGLWEARLGRNRFSGAVHTYAPGLKQDHAAELMALSDHVILNSLQQYDRFANDIAKASCRFGLRINPRHSEVASTLYDPCAAWSRLGVPVGAIADPLSEHISGLHLHALCDQGYAPFDRLLAATEQAFAFLFDRMDWINLGGGQLLTAPDYPVDRLAGRLADFSRRTGLKTYLEPGTAVVLNAGALVTEVLDRGWNDGHFCIVDASATCHMPDIIEAPYTPEIIGASVVDTAACDDSCNDHIVRLGGPTCLAGDVIGTYRFDKPPQTGERLLIMDQAYYTMVKTSTFNGTPPPAIALWDRRTDQLQLVRQFDYETFETRLA